MSNQELITHDQNELERHSHHEHEHENGDHPPGCSCEAHVSKDFAASLLDEFAEENLVARAQKASLPEIPVVKNKEVDQHHEHEHENGDHPPGCSCEAHVSKDFAASLLDEFSIKPSISHSKNRQQESLIAVEPPVKDVDEPRKEMTYISTEDVASIAKAHYENEAAKNAIHSQSPEQQELQDERTQLLAAEKIARQLHNQKKQLTNKAIVDSDNLVTSPGVPKVASAEELDTTTDKEQLTQPPVVEPNQDNSERVLMDLSQENKAYTEELEAVLLDSGPIALEGSLYELPGAEQITDVFDTDVETANPISEAASGTPTEFKGDQVAGSLDATNESENITELYSFTQSLDQVPNDVGLSGENVVVPLSLQAQTTTIIPIGQMLEVPVDLSLDTTGTDVTQEFIDKYQTTEKTGDMPEQSLSYTRTSTTPQAERILYNIAESSVSMETRFNELQQQLPWLAKEKLDQLMKILEQRDFELLRQIIEGEIRLKMTEFQQEFLSLQLQSLPDEIQSKVERILQALRKLGNLSRPNERGVQVTAVGLR